MADLSASSSEEEEVGEFGSPKKLKKKKKEARLEQMDLRNEFLSLIPKGKAIRSRFSSLTREDIKGEAKR